MSTCLISFSAAYQKGRSWQLFCDSAVLSVRGYASGGLVLICAVGVLVCLLRFLIRIFHAALLSCQGIELHVLCLGRSILWPASLPRGNWAKKILLSETMAVSTITETQQRCHWMTTTTVSHCKIFNMRPKKCPDILEEEFLAEKNRWSRYLHVATDPFRSTACTRVLRSFLAQWIWKILKVERSIHLLMAVFVLHCFFVAFFWFRFVLVLYGLDGIVSSNVDRTSSKPVVAVFAKVLMNTRDASLVFFCSVCHNFLSKDRIRSSARVAQPLNLETSQEKSQ